ncbi:hypothetical protein ACQJBY_073433 [Aegilops geniculata]
MAGVECVCPGKRKATSFSGEEPSPTAKRTAGCSGGDKKAHPRGEEEIPAAAAGGGRPDRRLVAVRPSRPVPRPEARQPVAPAVAGGGEGRAHGAPLPVRARVVRAFGGVRRVPGQGPPRVRLQRIRGGRLRLRRRRGRGAEAGQPGTR